MKKQYLLLTATITVTIICCSNPQQTNSAATPPSLIDSSSTASSAKATPIAATASTGDQHNSRNALDWFGVYKGILPCADCGGIITTITLARDNSFTRNLVYKGKDDKSFFDKGNFTWDSTGSNISIKGADGSITQFKVGENLLMQLDRDGNKITGKNADKYVLQKNPSDPRIEGKKWILTDLMGKPIDQSQLPKQAFIQFDPETGTFAGNATCNNVFGSYELKQGNRITFGRAGSTMMACKDMSTEKTFLDVLQRADNYSVTDTSFSLNKAKMAPLAKFTLAK